jgi:hypothetical protein
VHENCQRWLRRRGRVAPSTAFVSTLSRNDFGTSQTAGPYLPEDTAILTFDHDGPVVVNCIVFTWACQWHID